MRVYRRARSEGTLPHMKARQLHNGPNLDFVSQVEDVQSIYMTGLTRAGVVKTQNIITMVRFKSGFHPISLFW